MPEEPPSPAPNDRPPDRFPRLRVTDPDHQLLHRGLRTTIGQFSLVLVGVLVVGNVSFTLFAAFGSFAVLALAELGGPRAARPRAYAALAVAGAIGVAVGTAASENVVAGASVMVLVVFTLQFATVFGGYVAAAEPAVLLAFVLGIMVPGSPADVLPREIGWLTACAVGTVLALVVWPPPDTRLVSEAYAKVCRSIASVLRAIGQPRSRNTTGTTGTTDSTGSLTAAEVAATMASTRARVLAQPTRPAGPTEHDQALAILTDELNRATVMLGRLEDHAAAGPSPIAPAQQELAEIVASAFDASAQGLERGEPPTITPLEIERARDHHLEALTAWIEQEIAVCDDPTPIMEAARRAFPLRVLSLAAVSINTNVSILGGMEVDTDPLATRPRTPGGSDAGATRRRAEHILADHLHLHAVWFRNSARAAVSLALALCVAQIGGFDHAFWIVLGALSVLRSNAMGTSRTAVEAILGNLLGFAVAALVLTVAGDDTLVLWSVLPFAIFLSAYTPKAVDFVLGQASFGLLVVVLFNLIAPEGIVTGVQRVQNVMIGAGLSVVIAFLFWPRGAGAALRDSMASLYRADAAFLDGAVADMLDPDVHGPGAPVHQTRTRDLDAARRQANAAYGTYLNERGSKRMEHDDWGTMFGVATGMRLAADSIEQLARIGFSSHALTAPRVTRAHAALTAAWQQRIATVEALADALTPSRSGRPDPATAAAAIDTTPRDPAADRPQSPAALDAVVSVALQDAHEADDLRPALGLVFLTAWLGVADHLISTIREPVQRAEQTNARPWYR